MTPNRDIKKLDPTFRRKLEAVIADLAGHGLTIVLVEGWRSAKRQAYLYAQGRSRPGPIVTYKDGVKKQSRHQSSRAADVYFADGKHLYLPPFGAPEWKLLASSCKAHDLYWGGWNRRFKDGPHVEWRGGIIG